MSKKLLGTISPAYGIATGHGLFGKMPFAGKGIKSFSPALSLMDDDEKEGGMKAGGRVSGKKRSGCAGDGCVVKGKTRGQMR